MQKSGMRQKSCSKNKLILMIATDHSQNSSFIPFTLYLFIHAFFGCNSLTESLMFCPREQAMIWETGLRNSVG